MARPLLWTAIESEFGMFHDITNFPQMPVPGRRSPGSGPTSVF